VIFQLNRSNEENRQLSLLFFCRTFIHSSRKISNMSLFEMAAGSRFVKLSFDALELGVIRAACASVSEKEYECLGGMTPAELDQAARQAKKAIDSDMVESLVMLFKPGQDILIEREDMEPVLESIKTYGDSVSEEYAGALQSAREKIERCFR